MSQDQNVVVLDVREMLRKKEEPFQAIMDTVKSLKPDDVFELHATFNPIPLLKVMEGKGYANESTQLEEEHWVVRFFKKG